MKQPTDARTEHKVVTVSTNKQPDLLQKIFNLEGNKSEGTLIVRFLLPDNIARLTRANRFLYRSLAPKRDFEKQKLTALLAKNTRPTDHYALEVIAADFLHTTVDAIRGGEMLETSLIQHAKWLDKNICSSISDNININGHATYNATNDYYEKHITMEYRSLNLQQIQQICAAYKTYYGRDIIAKVIKDGRNYTVCFDAEKFVRRVLPVLQCLKERPSLKAAVSIEEIRTEAPRPPGVVAKC